MVFLCTMVQPKGWLRYLDASRNPERQSDKDAALKEKVWEKEVKRKAPELFEMIRIFDTRNLRCRRGVGERLG